MRILHAVTMLEIGGAEGVLERLVTGDSLNEHVVVSLYREGPIGRRLKERGIQVYALGFERGSIPDLNGAVALWKIIKKHRPQLVQTWMYHANFFASIIARFAGVRTICWNIRRTAPPRARSTRIFSRLSASLSSVLPDRIISCANAAVAAHVGEGYNASRFVVIPNGIDVSLFSPSDSARLSIREELGLNHARPVLGCVGRLHPDKGHTTLFEALRLLRMDFPDLVCVLAGFGTDTTSSELTKLARQSGVEDRIIPLGERNDIPAIMNAIDLYVSPSLTEGFPNAIAEAMACGTPSVATDVGDSRAIIGDCGWLVAPRDPEALASAVARGLKFLGSNEWREMKQACRARCESLFSLGRMIEAYQEVWLQSVQGGQAEP